MEILIGAAFVFMLLGFFAYNPLRRKYAGVVGVGGSYVILLGVMMLVAAIGQIIRTARGEGNISPLEVVLGIVVAVLGLGYMVYVMFTRCSTVAQRVALPFVACLIGFGFCWRFLAALVFHTPMESGKSVSQFSFPAVIYDSQENQFRLLHAGGDNATYYCDKTGQHAMFYQSDVEDGMPTGWRKG